MPDVWQASCLLWEGVEQMSPTEKLRYRNMEDYGFGPNVMRNTKVCVRCGKMVKANTKTCPDCGEKLPGETLFDRYKRQHKCCPDCDTVLASDSQYCPNCGKQILQKAVGYQENTPQGGRSNET